MIRVLTEILKITHWKMWDFEYCRNYDTIDATASSHERPQALGWCDNDCKT